jgi:hypothetical protein
MINIFRTFNTDFNRTIKGKTVVDLISAIKNGDTYVNVDTPSLSSNSDIDNPIHSLTRISSLLKFAKMHERTICLSPLASRLL